MEEMSESPLTQKKKLKLFPWIKTINRRFSKSFPADYDLETLNLFHREVEKELETISINSLKKNEALFSTLMCFYNHFCWKIKWKEDSPHMKSSCAKILSSLSKVGLVLSKGNVESKWLNQVLSALKVFPGDNDSLYGALLHISRLKKKYQSAYSAVLRHILCCNQHRTQEPSTYFKLMFLFRRLKLLSRSSYERAEVVSLASRVATPLSTISWLISNNLEELCEIKMTRMGHKLMGRKFSKAVLEKLREVILPDLCVEKSIVLEENKEANAFDQFFIDYQPAAKNREIKEMEIIAEVHTSKTKKKTLKKSLSVNSNEIEAESHDLKENVKMNPETNEQIVKSKRKYIIGDNESTTYNVSKKKKTSSSKGTPKLNEKFAKNEVFENQESAIECIDLSGSSDEIQSPSYSDFASKINCTTPSNSHKKKKNKIPRGAVSRNEIDENVGDQSLNDQLNFSFITAADEIESGSSRKNKKKRKTLNITQEEIHLQDIIEDQSHFGGNDSVCVQSIKNQTNSLYNSTPEPTSSASKKRKVSRTLSLQPASSNVESFEKCATSEGDVSNSPFYIDNTPTTKRLSAFKKYLREKVQESIVIEKETSKHCEAENDEDSHFLVGDRNVERDSTRKKSYLSKKGNLRKETGGLNLSVQRVKEDLLENSFEADEQPTSMKISEQKNHQKGAVGTVESKEVDNEPGMNHTTPRKCSKKNKGKNTTMITPLKENLVIKHTADVVIKISDSTKECVETEVIEELRDLTEESNSNHTVDHLNSVVDLIEESDTPNTEIISESHSDLIVVKSNLESDTIETNIKAIETIVDLEKVVESIDETIAELKEVVESLVETEEIETIAEIEEVVETIADIKKVVESLDEFEEIETIPEIEEVVESIDETEAAETIDEKEAVESIAEAIVESVDKAEAVVETIAEAEAVETIDETKAIESIAETETSKSVEVVESIDETEAKVVESIGETVAIVESIDEAKAVESIDETEAVEYIDETEVVKSIDKTEAVETIDETEAVETIDETEAVESINETETVETTDETEVVKSIDKTEAVETIDETEPVETIDGTEAVESIDETETVESIDETEAEPIDETEVVKSIDETEAVNTIDETEAAETIDETEAVESIDETEAVESIDETEVVKYIDETEAVETTDETKVVKSIDKTEAVETIDETEAVETIDEMEAVETIDETEAAETIDGMEAVESIDGMEARESIDETEAVESIDVTEVVKSINETEAESIDETEAVESIDVTEVVKSIDETEADSIYQTEAVESIDVTEVVKSIDETDAESIDETEAVESIDKSIADLDAVESIAKLEAITEPNTVEYNGENGTVNSNDEANSVKSIAEPFAVQSNGKTDAVKPNDEAGAVECNVKADASVSNVSNLHAGSVIPQDSIEPTDADIQENPDEYNLQNNSFPVSTQDPAEESNAGIQDISAKYISTPSDSVPDATSDSIEIADVNTKNIQNECNPTQVHSVPDTQCSIEVIIDSEIDNLCEALPMDSGKFISQTESQLEKSITKLNSQVKGIFHDVHSNEPARECLSPCKKETACEPSVKNVNSVSPEKSSMSAENNAEELNVIEKDNLEKVDDLLTGNDDIPLSSKINSNTIPDIIQEHIVGKELKNVVIEEGTSNNNIQDQNEETTQFSEADYCKILLKEVREDDFEEDSEKEVAGELDSIGSESKRDVPSSSFTVNSSEENFISIVDEAQSQPDEFPSSIKDISNSNIAADKDNEVTSKEVETVESVAEALYQKLLKAKENKLSPNSRLSEETAADILTENTVNYVIGKIIKKVECVDNVAKGQSFEDFKSIVKKGIKFTPERSQLPKLGNLSNLKPFVFPGEESECLSFVDVLKEKVSDSNEIENSHTNAHSPARRKNFYPYRNLLAIEVLDDKSESNFSDAVSSDKLDETICVSDESTDSDTDDERMDTNNSISESPTCSRADVGEEIIIVEDSEHAENAQSEAIIDEPIKPKSSMQKLQVTPTKLSSETSAPGESDSVTCNIANVETPYETIEGSRRDSGELINLVQTIQVPTVNLGSRCDEKNFDYQKENSSEKQSDMEDAVEEQSPTNKETIMCNQDLESTDLDLDTKSDALSEILASDIVEAVTTRKLRKRNVSSAETEKLEIAIEKQLTPERSCRTRLRRKPSTQETPQNTESESAAPSASGSLRRSSKRLKKDINIKLRDEFDELSLNSPKPKRRDPIIFEAGVDMEDISNNSDNNVKSLKVKRRTTRSFASSGANSKDCPRMKDEVELCDPAVEVENVDAYSNKEDSLKETLNVGRRTTRSVSTKITKYFASRAKLDLTPVSEKEAEDEVKDANGVESSSTENLKVTKRSTRSASVASDKGDLKSKGELDSFPVEDEEAEVDDFKADSGNVKSSKDNVKNVRRSTRATSVASEKGGSKSKLSQTPIEEESDGEDVDTRSTISEESLKENAADEEDKDYSSKSKTVKSSARAYNLRSKRTLIRPSKLNILRKTEDNHS